MLIVCLTLACFFAWYCTFFLIPFAHHVAKGWQWYRKLLGGYWMKGTCYWHHFPNGLPDHHHVSLDEINAMRARGHDAEDWR